MEFLCHLVVRLLVVFVFVFKEVVLCQLLCVLFLETLAFLIDLCHFSLELLNHIVLDVIFFNSLFPLLVKMCYLFLLFLLLLNLLVLLLLKESHLVLQIFELNRILIVFYIHPLLSSKLYNYFM